MTNETTTDVDFKNFKTSCYYGHTNWRILSKKSVEINPISSDSDGVMFISSKQQSILSRPRGTMLKESMESDDTRRGDIKWKTGENKDQKRLKLTKRDFKIRKQEMREKHVLMRERLLAALPPHSSSDDDEVDSLLTDGVIKKDVRKTKTVCTARIKASSGQRLLVRSWCSETGHYDNDLACLDVSDRHPDDNTVSSLVQTQTKQNDKQASEMFFEAKTSPEDRGLLFTKKLLSQTTNSAKKFDFNVQHKSGHSKVQSRTKSTRTKESIFLKSTGALYKTKRHWRP